MFEPNGSFNSSSDHHSHYVMFLASAFNPARVSWPTGMILSGGKIKPGLLDLGLSSTQYEWTTPNTPNVQSVVSPVVGSLMKINECKNNEGTTRSIFTMTVISVLTYCDSSWSIFVVGTMNRCKGIHCSFHCFLLLQRIITKKNNKKNENIITD